jgi:uncharacterized protein (DUF2062 family)
MRKYLRDRIHSLLKLDDPPHRLALGFAWGVFIAFSPTIGLHIISCIVVAWLFRLSKLVVLTASFINNTWTIVPLYGFCIWFGIKITGQAIAVPQVAWNDLTVTDAYLTLKPFFWPYIVGTLTAGTVAAILSYALFYWAVVRYRRAERPPAGP